MNRISSFIATLLVLACVMQTVLSNDPKIINGELAVKGQFPFIVQLFNKTANYNFCGGSVIGPYHILTAAHCIDGAHASEVQIWAGALNLYSEDGYRVNVQAIFPHPNYDASIIANDVAVIKLSKPFPKSVGVRTVKLPTTSAAAGTTVTASGFGSIAPEGGTYPEDLMWVNVPIIKNADCMNYYSIIQGNQMICVFNEFNQGTCYGDSGGPVVTGSKVNAVQQGVVSFGSGNGCASAPSVFARVSYFRPWILEQTIHTVSTGCVECAADPVWEALCDNVQGNFVQTASAYQCRNLDIDKTRMVDFDWDGCTNNKVRNLCEKVGRYACDNSGTSPMGTCRPL